MEDLTVILGSDAEVRPKGIGGTSLSLSLYVLGAGRGLLRCVSRFSKPSELLKKILIFASALLKKNQLY